MLWLCRICLVMAGWGVVLLVLALAPGIAPLPPAALDISALAALGPTTLVFYALRPHGPVILWRHRPYWWPLPMALALLVIVVGIATRGADASLADERGVAVVTVIMGCLSAPLAEARRSIDLDS